MFSKDLNGNVFILFGILSRNILLKLHYRCWA